jgi:hypothetical protein
MDDRETILKEMIRGANHERSGQANVAWVGAIAPFAQEGE